MKKFLKFGVNKRIVQNGRYLTIVWSRSLRTKGILFPMKTFYICVFCVLGSRFYKIGKNIDFQRMGNGLGMRFVLLIALHIWCGNNKNGKVDLWGEKKM